MFRTETLVEKWVIGSLAYICFFSFSVLAQTNSDSTNQQGSDAFWAKRCDDATILKLSDDEKAERKAKCAEYEKSSISNLSPQKCEDAENDFGTAVGLFTGSCNSVGLPTDDPSEQGKAGAIGCSWSMKRCDCLSKGLSEDDRDKYRCDELKTPSAGAFSLTNQNLGLIDIGSAKKRMQVCPHAEKDDTATYEAQVKASQDRIKELKAKMPEILNKVSEAEDTAITEQNDAKREEGEIKTKFANTMREIKRRKEGEEQQAVAEMTQIREGIAKTEEQIRALEQSKIDQEIALKEAMVQIEMQCHTAASEKVQQIQAIRLQEIKAGKYNMGSFNSVMATVGISTRNAWERQADFHYKQCLKSRRTREVKTSATRKYDAAIKQIDLQISTARQAITRAEQSIGQIFSKNGCTPPVANAQNGGVSGESRTCRSLRQANEDAQEAQREASDSYAGVQQKVASSQQKLAKKKRQLELEYNDAQQDLNDEMVRMENLRQYLNAKRELGVGAGGTKANEDLSTNYGKLAGAATNLDSCCADGLAKKNCDQAKAFLLQIGREPSQGDPSFDTPPLTSTPPPGTGSTSGTGSNSGTDNLTVEPESAR